MSRAKDGIEQMFGNAAALPAILTSRYCIRVQDAGADDAGVVGPTGRAQHTATLLADGRVLIAGGIRGGPGFTNVPLASASVYDPATGTFASVASMSSARFGHSATRLADGRVLIAGGRREIEALASAEIFDPTTGLFQSAATMVEEREAQAAALLPDGRVLLAGGQNRSDGSVASTEIYDPAADAFEAGGFLFRQASLPIMAALPSDTFLVAGGHNGGRFNDAQIYDVANEVFVRTGSMIQGRVRAFSAVLSDGRIVIGGGGELNVEVPTIEIYDPETGTFSAGGTVLTPTRSQRTASVLEDDRLLIVGGLEPVEIYDAATATSVLASADASFVPRTSHTATPLDDGRILFVGGYDADGFTMTRADLFGPTIEAFTRTGDLPSN